MSGSAAELASMGDIEMTASASASLVDEGETFGDEDEEEVVVDWVMGSGIDVDGRIAGGRELDGICAGIGSDS